MMAIISDKIRKFNEEEELRDLTIRRSILQAAKIYTENLFKREIKQAKLELEQGREEMKIQLA